MGAEIDFTSCSFDEFVQFVFDRAEADSPDNRWRQARSGDAFDPVLLCRHLMRLFRAPEFLAGRYPAGQLEEGCWFLMGSAGMLNGLLSPSEPADMPFPIPEELIGAMVDLFARFFATNPLDTACFMWWDGLRELHEDFEGDGDSERPLRGAIFEALGRILRLDARHCQVSALHGLGHLEHPGKDRVIREYLDRNPDLDEETRRYAGDAAAGKVL